MSLKIILTKRQIFHFKLHQIQFRPGFRPRPSAKLTALPRPLAGFGKEKGKEKGRERKKGEEKGRGYGGRVEGEEEGRGKGGSRRL